MGEYNIWELYKSPCAKFKIKIFQIGNNDYTGYTNILIADEIGDYYCALGYGSTEEEALEETIEAFFEMTSRKEEWNEEDFQYADPFDF